MTGMNDENVIEATGLTRYYRDKRGVRDLDLAVPAGTILGLLGENGCGKTTAMKLAMGMLLPDRGQVRTLGVDPAQMPPEIRARVGWLSDALSVPNRFTLADAMELQAAYFPSWDAALARKLAGRLELKETDVFARLSLGQKRRFMLVLVIAQRPDLLVMDEPAGGLDPAVRRQLIDMLIEQAAERPMTIVLSSHILSDVERLVERVAFMKDGRVVKEGDLETLRARVKRLCLASEAQDAVALARERFRVIGEEASGGAWLAVVEDFEPEKLDGLEATVEHMNLEEMFLAYNAVGATRPAM
jgi:ABC-2 type transport system ATP-binding protein